MSKTLTLLIAIIISTGCATRIKSNKDTAISEKITKLYITIKGQESAQPFFESFMKNFSAKLSEKGVQTNQHIYDPLSLDTPDEITNKINSFAPNLVMVINQTEARKTVNNGYGGGFGPGGAGSFPGRQANTGATFDVQLFQPSSDKPVWRANIKVDGQFGLKSASIKTVEKLINKLIEDQLL